MRENERELSRSPPRETAREPNGREKRDSKRPWSPNGRDRYRGDEERRAKEANGRDGNRYEEARSQPPRDRERDREKDRNPRDGDRREDRLKDERTRRDGVRDGDRERERERLDGRSDAQDGSRRDRKERENAERLSDRRESLDQGKVDKYFPQLLLLLMTTCIQKTNASATGGPPSEPRAMKANKSTVSDASMARVGALQSESSIGNSSSSRGASDSHVPQSKLLSRISQEGQGQPPTGPSRAPPAHRQGSGPRRNQPGPDTRNGSGVPSKRTGPDVGGDPVRFFLSFKCVGQYADESWLGTLFSQAKRFRLDRRDLNPDDGKA